MDTLTQRERSKLMAKIRSRGNKGTEGALARLLRANKISGWRRHARITVEGGKPRVGRKTRSGPRPSSFVSRLAVRPDFVFRQGRFALFVDGCFWHGCPKHGTQPKGNAAFWKNKFARNIARDILVTKTLRRSGWCVLRIWEHTLQWATKKPQNEARLLRRIQRALL